MELISEVDKYLTTKYYHVDYFFKIYSFANENIDGYMQYFDYLCTSKQSKQL